MLTEFKEEPMDEPPMEISFQDVGNIPAPGSGRLRERLSDTNPAGRLPDVTESSIDAMNHLLQQWGLEALNERFEEHLIDLNVLDYILDVDIFDLCRDFPIRYRLVLRHNLRKGYHKQAVNANKRPATTITFINEGKDSGSDPIPDRKKKRKKTVIVAPPPEPDTDADVDPADFVSVVEDVSIRTVLLRDPKFRATLNQLDQGIVPDTQGLRYMNRLVTTHFFEERILERSDYPKKEEKHALAMKILDAYPQLESTRVTPDAPRESYFFWLNGGKSKGPHSGLIEYRTTNLRREVPPENRRFLRKEKKPVSYVLPDSIRQQAAKMAKLPPLPSNEQTISEGMAECKELHSCILQQTESDTATALVTTFPHLLSYNGKMIQQVFPRLHTTYESSARLDKFLLLGLLLDDKTFARLENKFIRATLRMMKKLIISGKNEGTSEMSTEEADASALIRWIQSNDDELEIYTVQRHTSEQTHLPPHIACVADVGREGNMYVVFQGKFIPCGTSALHALDVFFKLFSVCGIPVPVTLRKIHELLMVYLWKVTSTSRSVTVSKLMSRLKAMETNDDADYEEEDDLM